MFRDPQWQRATSTSGVGDNFSGLPPPPADHSRSTLSHLAHAGGATPAAPSCRVLGRDSNQTFGCPPDCLAVAAAGRVCSQGAKSNNVWCLVAVPSFFLPTPGVIGAAGGAHSQARSGSNHASLWPLIQLLWSVPATCRSRKRHHVAPSPPAALSPPKRFPASHSLHKKHPVSCSPSKWILTTHSPYQRCPSDSLCARGDSYGGLPLLSSSATRAPCFSCRPRPPPGFPLLWHSTPQPVAYKSLAPQAVPTQPAPVLFPRLTSRA